MFSDKYDDFRSNNRELRLRVGHDTDQLPFFLFNLAAQNNFVRKKWEAEAFYGKHTVGHLASNRFYRGVDEVTPLWYGSDDFTYNSEADFPIHHAVALSGAAYEPHALIRIEWLARIMSSMNHDLGLYHDNNPVGESREWERGSIEKHRPWKFGPFPLHSIYFHQNQTPLVDISLSDGGHSDNLGIYSLLKRGC